MSAWVNDFQPCLVCLGKPQSMVTQQRACQPENAKHMCEEFLARGSPEAKGRQSSLQPLEKMCRSLQATLKPEGPCEIPGSPVTELALPTPQQGTVPPRPSLGDPPSVQLTLCEAGIGWDWLDLAVGPTSLGCAGPESPSFRAAGQPRKETKPSLSLWTHSLCRGRLHSKLTQQYPLHVFSIVLTAFFFFVEIKN